MTGNDDLPPKLKNTFEEAALDPVANSFNLPWTWTWTWREEKEEGGDCKESDILLLFREREMK
jgi:hypothetical protein